MAEVASGKSWAQLFDDTLRTPLGLDAGVAYFTAAPAVPRNDGTR